MKLTKKSIKKVGIIGRGLHGYQSALEISRYFKVSLAVLPENLPEVLESFEEIETVEGSLDDVLNSDLVICYANHPDISLFILEMCSASLVIITGERGKTGSLKQIERIAESRDIKVLMPEVCCIVRDLDEFYEFFKFYGKPKFSFEVRDNTIVKAKVERCAFCGATRYVAEKLIGKKVEEAPTLAGLYTQIYPCMASRGLKGGIHIAAEMHKVAVEKALRSGAGGI